VTKPFQCSDLDLLDSIIQTEIQTPMPRYKGNSEHIYWVIMNTSPYLSRKENTRSNLVHTN